MVACEDSLLLSVYICSWDSFFFFLTCVFRMDLLICFILMGEFVSLVETFFTVDVGG